MADRTVDGHDEGASALPLFAELSKPSCTYGTTMDVQFGRPIPPQQRVLLYSSDEWEEFILEWVQSQKAQYLCVLKFAGANDMGIDIAGFVDEKRLVGIWDNYQCKHHEKPLIPADAAAEIAKIIWHSFRNDYLPPRKYYFVAPRDCGMKLKKLLSDTGALRDHVIENWTNQCSKRITAAQPIVLEGAFKKYVESFDFGIFSSRTLLEVVDDHRLTPYHAIRFGGGLPGRPAVSAPPEEPVAGESRYIQQIFEAYSDHMKTDVTDLGGLVARKDLKDHFHRQREFFYHAESLRNFARDTVPPGTFEDLQDELYAGVIDIESGAHQDGYARLNAVTQTATGLQLTSNALISVIKTHDRKGICHQLANDDRLHWRKS
jgi:hypothetical protein